MMKKINPENDDEDDDPAVREHKAYIRQLGFGLLIGTCGYLISGIFLSAFYYPNIWTLTTMMTANYLIGKRMEEHAVEPQIHNES